MSSETLLVRPGPPSQLELQIKLFRGLADLSRLSILEVLRDGPRSVGEIVAATTLSQPNASNHLRCLSECGLVTSQQRGRFVHYQLADARIADLLALAEELLDETARGIGDCRKYAEPK